MKCPHCGIEIRDTSAVCMYCGGKIPHRKGSAPPVMGKATDTPTRPAQKNPAGKRPAPAEAGGDEEEEGGLSACLQPGEQVLIGALNVSVKKFFFHAYLTERRIFLIDTQEKKLKVTAKDIPLETITETGVEISENSDPVLVLSIASADDEVKTMKLVFSGGGIDRSSEVDEWLELLMELSQGGKQKRHPPARNQREPEPEEPEEEPAERAERPEPEEPAPAEPKTGPSRTDLRPAKRPVKDHEKQPPVKRLLTLYKEEPEGEEEPAPVPEHPAKTPRPAAGTAKRGLQQQEPAGGMPPVSEPEGASVKKVGIQPPMKGALKGALQPVGRAAEMKPHRPVAVPRTPVQPEPEPKEPERAGEPVAAREEPAEEEAAGAPLFCQNCGKKLPAAANFCPGCGTRISAPREKPAPRVQEKGKEKHAEPAPGQKLPEHRQVKPPVKRAPKGSETTILHKFLRR